MSRTKDYTGMKWGMLTALRLHGTDQWRKALWLFQCECGDTKVLPAEKVKRKKDPTVSCGCLRRKQYRGIESLAYNLVYKKVYADGDLTFEQFMEMSQEECYYCGEPPSNQMNKKLGHFHKGAHAAKKVGRIFVYNGLDRLDNSRGHDFANCVPCCWDCNSFKSSRDFGVFMNKISEIYHRRLV